MAACQGSLAFAQNRAKWESHALNRYGFAVVVHCFCPYAGAEVTYVVEKCVLTIELVRMSEDSEADVDNNRNLYDDIHTIEKTFKYLERANTVADHMTVGYDLTYGFPTRISIDWIERAVDDEFDL